MALAQASMRICRCSGGRPLASPLSMSSLCANSWITGCRPPSRRFPAPRARRGLPGPAARLRAVLGIPFMLDAGRITVLLRAEEVIGIDHDLVKAAIPAKLGRAAAATAPVAPGAGGPGLQLDSCQRRQALSCRNSTARSRMRFNSSSLRPSSIGRLSRTCCHSSGATRLRQGCVCAAGRGWTTWVEAPARWALTLSVAVPCGKLGTIWPERSGNAAASRNLAQWSSAAKLSC